MSSRTLPLDEAARAELDLLREGAELIARNPPRHVPDPLAELRGRTTGGRELPALPEPPADRMTTGFAERAETFRRTDPGLGAFVWTDWTPRAAAGPLAGIPFGVKENIDVAGHPTNAGRGVELARASTDAAVVAALRRAGAVPVAGCSMTELALALDGNPHRRTTRNPHDPVRIAGGSSSGSAVAVASGMVDFALGTDTGGSVRIPAAFCGVLGLKPTFGAVPMPGCVPLAPTLDHLGVLTATASRAATVLDAVSDLRPPGPGLRRRVRIGWPVDWAEQADPAVATRCLDRLRSAPVELVELGLPVTATTSAAANYLVLAAEAARSLAAAVCADPAPDPRVLATVAAGSHLGGHEVELANRQRLRIAGEQLAALRRVDAIATPTVGVTAPEIGAPSVPGGRTLPWPEIGDRFTAASNCTGFPAVSVPVTTGHPLPAGVQLIAGPGEDRWLLRLAGLLEPRNQRQGGR
ncbi:amidase [Sciscionella marina]|uniref:amidase n=1 Tax=Sciscionella marina TaxID=508770 RepID=UPI000371510C|nr:amidase [Sciscionella marina]